MDTGAEGTQGGPFKGPSAGPTAGTGHNLNEIMDKAPSGDNTNGAAPASVGAGKTYWGLGDGGNWGPQTGTMETKTLSPGSADVEAGYYETTTLSAEDTDLLVAGNIKSGVTIFGVPGELHGGCDCSGGTLNVFLGTSLNNSISWVRTWVI